MTVDDLELIYRNTSGRLQEPETKEAFTRVCSDFGLSTQSDERVLFRDFEQKGRAVISSDQEPDKERVYQFRSATMALGKLIASRTTGPDGFPMKFLGRF